MKLLDRFKKSRREAARQSVPGPAPDAPRDREEVLASLQAFVASQSDSQLTPENVDPSASLLEEGILDSIGGVQLLVHIEDTWGLEIEESELVGRLHNLENMVDFIVENFAVPARGSATGPGA